MIIVVVLLNFNVDQKNRDVIESQFSELTIFPNHAELQLHSDIFCGLFTLTSALTKQTEMK